MSEEREQKKTRVPRGARKQGRAAEVVKETPAESVAETVLPPEEPVAAAAVAEKIEEEKAVDEVAALRQELEGVKAKEAEYLDGWQRARAELSNARKRFQREQEQAFANARADVLGCLLPIVDDFERAFDTLPDNLSRLTWIEGVWLIQHKFRMLLEQEGVTQIDATGQEFDPFWHQAITHEPSAEVPEGQIIAELQKGYKLGERVLRPSMVRVSSGPPLQSEPEAESEGREEAELTNTEQS